MARERLSAPSSSSETGRQRPFRLSPAQEYLWESTRFKSLGKRTVSRENPFIALQVDGPFDLDRLREALVAIVHRNEILRTTLTDLGASPMQRVNAPADPPILVVDLAQTVPADRRTALTEDLLEGTRSRTFDLLAGPLWECLVVRIDATTHVLALAFCHLIIDGTALVAFLRQLGELYLEPDRTPHEWQYRHFVADAWATADVTESKLEYWRRVLRPIPYRFPFPTDHPPSRVSRTLRNQPFRSPLSGTELVEIRQRLGVTPYLLNVAAYAVVLAGAAHFEGDRIVFASSFARLDLKRDEDLVGCFLDVLFFPVVARPDMTVSELVAAVRRSFESAQENFVPYAELVRAVWPSSRPDEVVPGLCVYDVWTRGRIFDLQPDESVALFGDARASLFPTETRSGHMEFSHERQEEYLGRFHIPLLYLNSTDGASGYLRYDANQFDATRIRALADTHQAVIRAMSEPDCALRAVYSDAVGALSSR